MENEEKMENEEEIRNELREKAIVALKKEFPLASIMPSKLVDGNSFEYNRVLQEPNAGFVAVDRTIPQDQGQVVPVTANLTLIRVNAEFSPEFLEELEIEKKMEEVVISKAKAIWGTVEDALINGAGENKDFMDLKGLVSSEQTINYKGKKLTLDMMDEAFDRVKPRPNAIFMNYKTIRCYKRLLRDMRIAELYIELPNYKHLVLTYGGVPIIPNAFIDPDSDNKSTSIYFVYFDEDFGLSTITFKKRKPFLNVGKRQESPNKEQVFRTLQWPLNLILNNEKAVSRLTNVCVE